MPDNQVFLPGGFILEHQAKPTNRIDRLLRNTDSLAMKKYVSAEAISEKFNISGRSLP